MLGLESLHNIDSAMRAHAAWEKLKIVAILKEEEYPAEPKGIPLQLLLLRARVNDQRNYEIYEFTTKMTYEEVKSYFDSDPQVMADAIREIGYKVYSNRANIKERVIV